MENINNKYNVKKIITLWAFSESVLGGFLHLFKVPFTGLIVGGLAVIFLSLLSFTNDYKKNILKGTLVVLLIKFVISPYTPINAFFSVLAQGVLCYIFSIIIKNKQIRILTFSLSSMILFSLQKLIFLQILFGNSLWQAIDIYAKFIAKQVFLYNVNINLSWYLIIFYISIHIISGIIFTIITLKINEDLINEKKLNIVPIENNNNDIKTTGKKKKKINKVIKVLIILLVIVSSYFIQPEAKFLDYLIVVLRFFLIFIIWTIVLSPFLTKITKNLIFNKSKNYINDVDVIINDFSKIKALIAALREELKNKTGIIKYILLIRYVIVYYVLEN